jgi:hypothetical protein
LLLEFPCFCDEPKFFDIEEGPESASEALDKLCLSDAALLEHILQSMIALDQHQQIVLEISVDVEGLLLRSPELGEDFLGVRVGVAVRGSQVVAENGVLHIIANEISKDNGL